ncbi:MAG: putative spermidine/putrescine transport system ATP-binding protein [Thermoleophilaceae bacterium]|nr:putative spermidine/putrescine transport system ATP-binding protein [Thermoleophilaceae bacterium]
MTTVLDIQDVSKRYDDTVALKSATLSVVEGEFLTLLGPSGSGKTTLLRIIAGFQAPTGGSVLLRGRDITGLWPAERGIGMVFQQYALFPHMTVADNIAYGLKQRKWKKPARQERVREMLDLVRLPGLEGRYPRQLSGGQQQRVALARALAYSPEILLMDEPLGALDRTLRLEMEEELRRIHRDMRATVIYVTHDQQEALALSDRIAVMRAGEICALSTPEDLYRRPNSGFVARFFADANVLPAKVISESEGRAVVECLGGRLECSVTGERAEEMALVARRRSLKPGAVDGALSVRGTVNETLLLGEELEVTMSVPEVGRVVATISATALDEVAVGQELELFLPPDEAVLVPVD